MARNLRWRSIFFAGVVTAMAGFVDGVGFIHFGGYFLSFMSGNSTRSSASLMSGDVTGWSMAMGLVGSFVAGVVAATLLSFRAGAFRRPIVMFLSGLLLAGAAVLGTREEMGIGELGMPGACLLAAAMGSVNVSYTRSGEVSVGLTYMTGTLVKFGQHFAGALITVFSGGKHASSLVAWAPYAVLWSMITLGSVAGVFCYLHFGLASLWLVAAGMLLWAALALSRELRTGKHAPAPSRMRREIL